MNFLQELQQLDPKDIGRWPLLFRALAVGLIFVVLTGLLIYLVPMRNQMPDLDRARSEEVDLMRTFDERQRKAANFDQYRTQLKDMERSFGAMLRQLPGRTEVPSLLVDISQVGLSSGLQEKLFQPMPEVRKDFYAELPIRIRLTGSYHQFGAFVSGIAALPRIVTLHDISITPETKDAVSDRLVLDVTAKTYRYLDDAELAAADKGKSGAKVAPGRPGGPG
jgi:type IV pilus assembly protein PilO